MLVLCVLRCRPVLRRILHTPIALYTHTHTHIHHYPSVLLLSEFQQLLASFSTVETIYAHTHIHKCRYINIQPMGRIISGCAARAEGRNCILYRTAYWSCGVPITRPAKGNAILKQIHVYMIHKYMYVCYSYTILHNILYSIYCNILCIVVRRTIMFSPWNQVLNDLGVHLGWRNMYSKLV